MDDDQQAAILEATDALITGLERELANGSAPAEQYHAIYAAGGLLRGADLLATAVGALRSGRPDSVGVLIRTIIENWFVSAYLFHGGPTALARLEHELIRNQRAVLRNNGIEMDTLLDARRSDLLNAAKDAGLLDGTTFGNLSVAAIAGALSNATDGSIDGEQRYNTLYRSYSTEDAHGFASILRRLNLEDLEQLRVVPVGPWIDAYGSLAIAGVLMCELGEPVVVALGMDADWLHPINSRLLTVLAAVGAESLARTPAHIRDLLPPDLQPRP